MRNPALVTSKALSLAGMARRKSKPVRLPRTPGDMIFYGIALGVVGGFLSLATPLFLVIAAIGAVMLQVGVIAAGVRLGMAWAFIDKLDHPILDALIEE